MIHRFIRFALLLTFASMTISSSSGQSDQTTNLPSAVQTLQYLKQTIDWHQQFHETEQLANSVTEAEFLNDEHQLSKEILQLAFDFSKANAKLLAKQTTPAPT